MLRERCMKCNKEVEGETVGSSYDEDGILIIDIRFDCNCGHYWQSCESDEKLRDLCGDEYNEN